MRNVQYYRHVFFNSFYCPVGRGKVLLYRGAEQRYRVCAGAAGGGGRGGGPHLPRTAHHQPEGGAGSHQCQQYEAGCEGKAYMISSFLVYLDNYCL
jgi:hypothetical protein